MAPPKLTGTVGPGFTITLKRERQAREDAEGRQVHVRDSDKAAIHNFEIEGPNGVREGHHDRLRSRERRPSRSTLKEGSTSTTAGPTRADARQFFVVRLAFVEGERLDRSPCDPPPRELAGRAREDQVGAALPEPDVGDVRPRGLGRVGRMRVEDGKLVALVLEVDDEARVGGLQLEAVRARAGGSRREGSAPRRRRGARASRTPRSALPRRRAPLVPGAKRREPLPPVAALHRRLGVGRVPEVGGEVLPAAVGEDADDDALVELVGEACGDVDDRARGDARRRSPRGRRARARRRATRRSRRAASGRAWRRRGSGGT